MRRTPQKNLSSSHNFSLFNHKKTPLFTKIIISFLAQENNSKLTSWLIFLIEYLQLVSQLILMASNSYSQSENNHDFFYKIAYAAKLANPSHLLEYTSSGSLTTAVLYIILFSTVAKYVFLAFIITIVSLNKKPSDLASEICRWILKAQGRVLYFFLTSFWIDSLIKISLEKFSLFGLRKINSSIFCIFMIAIEGIFSVLTTGYYWCMFPTNCLLSSKDNYLEFLTLFQKIFAQFFQVILFQQTHITALKWIFASFNISFSLMKSFHYFKTLPIYNMRFLIHHWMILIVLFALDSSFFLQIIIIEFGYHISNFALLLMMATAVAILLSKAMNNLLKQRIFELRTANEHDGSSAKLFMHKIEAIKQLRNNTTFPSEFSQKFEWSYFINEGVNAHAEKIFSLEPQQYFKINIQDQTSFQDICANYLELLLNRFPRNHLMKLYIAHIYSQTLKKYGKSLRLIAELQNTTNFKVAINASLLAYRLQDLIKTDGYQNKSDNNNDINLSTFVKGQFYNAQLKENMSRQIKQQIQLCKEISQDRPNLSNIQYFAFLVGKYKQAAAHNISQIKHKMPEYNAEPFLLYALYQLVANFCPDQHQEYLKIYKHRQLKFLKYFQAVQLQEENIYQNDNVFLVLSGQKEEAGKIVSCSKSTEAVLGGDQKFYIGTKASSLFLPQTKLFDEQLLSQTLEAGNTQGLLSDSLRRGFLLHKDGHMIEVDYYVNIYPYLTHGLYLSLIIRPAPNPKDYILIHQNGEIEGITQSAGKKIRFFGSSNRGVNIELVSPELARVNTAFNKITSSERGSPSPKKFNLEEYVRLTMKEENSEDTETINKDNTSNRSFIYSFNEKKNMKKLKSKVSAEEAKNLHNLYSTEGGTVHLFPMKKNTGSFQYHCKITKLEFGSANMKLISLVELEANMFGSNPNLLTSPGKTQTPNKTLSPLTSNFNENDETYEDIKCEKLIAGERVHSHHLPDEKENGWINFDAIQTCRTTERQHLMTGMSPLLVQDTPIIFKDDDTLVTPITPSEKTKTRLAFIAPKLSRFRLQEEPSPGLIMEASPKVGANSIAAESQLSRAGSRTKNSQIFQKALNIKYYDKSFKVFSILFCVLLVSLFASEILLKANLDQTRENLQDNKQILINAQLRTCYSVFLQATFRQTQMIASGYLSPADLGLFYRPAAAYVSLLTNYTLSLSGINNLLLAQADSLGETARKSLFATDIRMFDLKSSTPAYPFINVTNFQATDKIVNTALVGIRKFKIQPAYSFPSFEYILRNSLNDLYLKNEQISDYFMDSIQNQIEDDQATKLAYLGIVMFFIVSTTIAMSLILIKNYKRETRHLDAFARFNSQIIKSLEENLKHFLKALHEGTSYLGNQDIDSIKTPQVSSFKKENMSKQHSKIPISSGIIRKYAVYFIRYIASMLTITALILWSVLAAMNCLDFLGDKITQLNFAYRMNTRVNMHATIAVELCVAPNSTLIQNEPLPIIMDQAVQDIKLLRTQVTTDIVKTDLAQNPKIQHVLFGDGCDVLDVLYVAFCKNLAAKSVSTNLIQLLSSLEELLVARSRGYKQSDKSPQALQSLEVNKFDVLVSIKRVLTGINFYLSQAIDNEIEEHIIHEQKYRKDIFVIFRIILVVLVVLVWIFIFSQIREVDNNLKKVLQTLPPELVLSSFILKSFLMKTSSGTLDTIKDKI